MKYNFLKKIFIFILTLALCLSSFTFIVSAEITKEVTYEEKKAAYRAQLIADDITVDDFLVGSWASFYSFKLDRYEYQLDQMAAAGINFNIFPKYFAPNTMLDSAYWTDIEKKYAERNMVYMMNGGMDASWIPIGVEYAKGKEHCIGYFVKDEPTGAELEQLGKQMRAYRNSDSVLYPFANLLPSYAGRDRLGGTYREHVEKYVAEVGAENVGYLSHDFYPFMANGYTDMNIFSDMEVLRSVAYENGKLKTHAFPQSNAWTNTTRMPNIDEMRWNVYGYLAYGFKALSWFNLICPGTDTTDSLIDSNGNIRDPELFDAWSELNWEIRGMSSILMNVDVAHAYHVIDNAGAVELLPKDYFLQPNEGLKNDFIISVMETKEGNDKYIMLFNKNMTSDTTRCSFKIDKAEGIESIDCFDPHTGEYESINISSGNLKDTFIPGEGKIYRLNYAENEEQAPEETPGDKPADTPVENPEENPEETPEETPGDKPADTPVEKPEENPEETPEETPGDEPADTPVEKPGETPADKPTDTPTQTPEEAPENIPSNTPDENAPEGTDSETAKDDKTEDNTDKEKSNKKGGCFSVVGAASAAVWATTLVGATLIFKRKKR